MAICFTRRQALSTCLAAAATPAVAQRWAGASYRDSSLPAAERARDLLARMTPEEKAAQMLCRWFGKGPLLRSDGSFSARHAIRIIPHGIGQFARPHDRAGLSGYEANRFREVGDSVALVNAIQRYLVEHTRLGIPALFHEEFAHGLVAKDATIFPIPTALGGTWDPDLIEQVFTVAAREGRSRGATVALTPVLDLIRDPRYGRCEEMFGEDPRLVAAMGVAAVCGLQGRQRPLAPDRVFSTLKHFVHAVPQGGLNIAPADISERSLRETFLVPFAKAIGQANPAIVMPAYNELEGVPCHEDVELLQGTGRRMLGFKGVYFSDYDGIDNLMVQQHVAASDADAAVLALDAGIAADLPEGKCYARLPELVRAGRVTMAQVDNAVRRILELKFEAGLFERPYVDPVQAAAQTGVAAHVALARKAAEKALVLLKNDGILPLEPKVPLRLAVIGPNAREPLYGGYSGINARGVGVLEGLRKAAPEQVSIEYAQGVWITPPDKDGLHHDYSKAQPVPEADDRARIAEAVAVAGRSDVILLVLGDVPAVTHESVGKDWPGDRSTLGLWGRQDELVEAMVATKKSIVALLINGRPLAISRLAEVANALVEAWYPGQEGGHAVADMLFGRVNPGGKLTVSFPRSVGELPVYYDRHPSADVNVYLEGPRRPVFPFGHGLSYTSFEISAPRLLKPAIAADENAEIEVDVVNTGERAGDEVVQLYIRDDVSSVPRPILELRAFQRVTLAPGEHRKLHFVFTPDDLAFWDIAMKWTVEPGTFTISAGPSSAVLKSATLTVTA